MCYQFTSYQFEETLRAFIKTNLDFADQGKRRSQRFDSKSRPKNQFRKLISLSDSKFFELVRRVIVTTSGKDSTRRITRHTSLDYNINENEML